MTTEGEVTVWKKRTTHLKILERTETMENKQTKIRVNDYIVKDVLEK